MVTLPDYLQLDPKLDRMPPEMMRDLQSRRLRNMVHYCYEEAPFWRRKFDAAGIKPDDIRTVEDIVHVPFCTKQELQDDQDAHPPFGSYIATHPTKWYKYMATSGTTGKPLRRVFSKRDWGYIIDKFKRNPMVGPGDIVVVLGPIDGLMGPTAGVDFMSEMGAMVVLAGLYDSKSKIRLIADLKPTVVNGTASYLLHLIEVAKEMGIDLKALGIRSLLSVGEPGAAQPTTRRILTEAWGSNIGDGFGMTELFPLGGGCLVNTALHIPKDMVIAETIDPETDKPVTPGEPGEMVYTNLIGDTQPLLRYRSRDIARVDVDGPCQCGFTGVLLKNSIEGRVDDMIWYRGANIFPQAIEAVIHGLEGLTPEYQIVVEGAHDLPTMTVRVEAENPVEGEALAALESDVKKSLSEAIRINVRVEVLAKGTLPRVDGRTKARRVVDKRAH